MESRTRPWVIHDYDRRKFDLRGAVSRLLDCAPLESLKAEGKLPLFTIETDQQTSFHRSFYDGFADGVQDIYEALIADVIAPILPGPFCYQTTPTFRVHLKDNVAVGAFHRDSDYNHSPNERNFWLPLTPAWDTNTVWILGDDGTYRCANALPGQIVQFDAANTMHGNYPNDTGATRVSFDFRCIPLDEYEDTQAKTVDAGRHLVIGDYFKAYGK